MFFVDYDKVCVVQISWGQSRSKLVNMMMLQYDARCAAAPCGFSEPTIFMYPTALFITIM